MNKKLFPLIFLLSLFLFNSSFASNSSFYKDAINEFEKKNFEKSKFLFQRYLVINPKDYSSYLYLAKIFEEEENQIEVEKNLNTTLLLNPKNEEALYMLMELQLSLSNFSKVKDLNEKFALICSKLCNKKVLIAEKMNNLQTSDETN
tara:strand:- start:70 stop:510 length:441 start_codon:yes stop_codon:yes gene_type:complete